MPSELSTYTALREQVASSEMRIDWSMAQFIDNQIDAVARGADHAELNRRMYERGVSEAVRRRVLSGHAVRRVTH